MEFDPLEKRVIEDSKKLNDKNFFIRNALFDSKYRIFGVCIWLGSILCLLALASSKVLALLMIALLIQQVFAIIVCRNILIKKLVVRIEELEKAPI